MNNNRRAGNDTLIIIYVLVGNNFYRKTAEFQVMLWFYFLFLVFVDQSVTKSNIVCKLTAALLYDLFLT